jgi:hypothetical protein
MKWRKSHHITPDDLGMTIQKGGNAFYTPQGQRTDTCWQMKVVPGDKSVALSTDQCWVAHVCDEHLGHTILNGKQCMVRPQRLNDDAHLKYVDIIIKQCSLSRDAKSNRKGSPKLYQ